MSETRDEDTHDAALVSGDGKTAEQWARDLMELCGWEDAQRRTSGDVVWIANLLSELRRARLREQEGERVEGWAYKVVGSKGHGEWWEVSEDDICHPSNKAYIIPCTLILHPESTRDDD